MSIMAENAMSEIDIDGDCVHRFIGIYITACLIPADSISKLRLIALYSFKINCPRRHTSSDKYESSVEDEYDSHASLNSEKENYMPRALFPSTDGGKRRRERCREALEIYLKSCLASQCLALCKQI
jgi:hypothetical protein